MITMSKLKFETTKTIQKSNLVGFGSLMLSSRDLEQFIGKKCLITGEIEIKEV